MLHRAICTNEQLADCSLVARLLYTWGLPHTSDWGVLSASPRHLKAQVFPLSDETAADVQAATEELCAAGLWVRFDADGGSYVYYPTFDKYQDLHQRRANTRDGMPLPPGYQSRYRKIPKDAGSSDEFPEVPGSSRNTPEVPDSSGEFPRTKGSEGKGKELNEGARAREQQYEPDPEPEKQPEPDPDTKQPTYPDPNPNDFSHMAAGNYPELAQSVREAQPEWSHQRRKYFTLDLIRAIEDDNTDVDEQQILSWLATDGSRPSTVDKGDGWLRRMLAIRSQRCRADPAAATDPAVAECIRRHGPRPEDQFDLREWGEWLKDIRAELAAAGAAR